MKLPRFIVGKNDTDSSRNSLNVPPENVLSLRKKDDFKIEINLTRVREIFHNNRKLLGPLSVLLLVTIVFFVALKGKASIVNFYPETCLGGWENPSNASGQPSVASDAQGSDFTRDNSAFLRNRTAQVFCGDFGGEVPQDSIPRKFTVRFSWFVDDGSFDKGEKIINEALDEGRSKEINIDSINNNDSTENILNTDGDLLNQESSEDEESTDTQAEDATVPSNENGSSDLPASEIDQGSEESNDSGVNDGSSSESTDSSQSDEGGSSSSDSGSGSDSGSSSGGADSSAGDNSGSGAFLERFFARAFAQEAEQSVSESPETKEETNVVSDTVEESTNTSTEIDTTKQESENNTTPSVLSEDSVDTQVDTQDVNENTGDSSETSVPSDDSLNEEANAENVESNGIVSLDETARDDLFRVMYTTDGEHWEELGLVKRNNWKNIEFEIPFSNVDSWEKLSKVQIAIESLPTIDSFPETYLDSVWVSVEYEGVNPDPLPQPDFLTDKVLDDIRYENIRVIRIVKPDGEHQIWYAFVPKELEGINGKVGGDEVIKTGDTSLQVIDASTLSTYDPLIGPTQNDVVETKSDQGNLVDTSEKLLQDDKDTSENSDQATQEVLGESIDADTLTSLSQKENTSEVTKVNTQPSDFEKVIDFVTPGVESDEKKEVAPVIQGEIEVLNEELIKQEGETTDLQDLNQPEWYWNLIARGLDVHPEYGIAVDSYKLFWITAAGDSMNMFGLDSSGTLSGTYIGGAQNIGTVAFIAPSGMSRFARFNKETAQFIFADE